MKTFAILASVTTAGVVAAGAYYFISTEKAAKVAKAKAAKEQFSYNNVITKFKDPTKQGDPLANAASGYANLGLKKFNEGEKLLEELESKPESVSKETVDAIFKSDHPFYRFLQGYCYEKGIGVPVDKEKAAQSYDVAQKLPFSRVRMAVCLIKGDGVKADPAKGIAELSSMINFADAKVSDPSSSVLEDGESYKTCLSGSSGSEYPPAALELAKVYFEGVGGVPKDLPKALECAVVAYANNLEGASKFMDGIFKEVLAQATEAAEAKYKNFNESSPEYQAEFNAFKAKNKSLQSMPDLMAKEFAKRMKGVLKRFLAEECKRSGWALSPDGKSGLSLAVFKLDSAKCFDSASDLLCAAQRAAMPPSARSGIQGVRETVRNLAATAKTYGLNDELLILNAYGLALDIRAGEGIKPSDFMNINSVHSELAKLNAERPSPASLVIERHILSCEFDYLSVELNDSNAKLQNLEASAPVRTFEYNSKEHVKFDGTGRTALEADADAHGGIGFKKSEAMSKDEMYSKNVSSAYAVLVNGGPAKNVSREEFGKLKSAYGSYLDEKSRLNKIIGRDQKALQLFDRSLAISKNALQPMVRQGVAPAKAPAAEAKAPEGKSDGKPL